MLNKDLEYLRHSMEEVETIKTLFDINTKNGKSQIYTGINSTKLQPTESILKNLKRAPRILHLSTHGFYLEKEENSPLGEAEPMVLSGLALAGADQSLKGILDKNGDDMVCFIVWKCWD